MVVCDGFTGNVALKTLEGGIGTTMGAFREAIGSNLRSKIGGLLIRPAARELRAGSTPTRTAAPTCSGCAASS